MIKVLISSVSLYESISPIPPLSPSLSLIPLSPLLYVSTPSISLSFHLHPSLSFPLPPPSLSPSLSELTTSLISDLLYFSIKVELGQQEWHAPFLRNSIPRCSISIVINTLIYFCKSVCQLVVFVNNTL